MTKQANNPREARQPKYHAYHVVDTTGEAKKARWNRIGVFFTHDDDQGGTLILDCLPIAFDGRIVLRAPKDNAGDAQ